MVTFQYGDFANLLAYFQVRIWLQYFQEDSGKTGAGEDIVDDAVDPLWMGEIVLDQRLTHAQAAAIDARIARLNGVIGRFYMYDPRLPNPIKDPNGTIISGATPKILDISNDRTQIRISDLPGNYPLSNGDRAHILFGTDPVHRAYFWMDTELQATGHGSTGWIDVAPHIPDGINVGDAIVLRRPSPLWRLEAGSVKAGAGQGQLTPGSSFNIVQVP